MKHEPVDVARARQHKPVADMSDDELGQWLASLPSCPGIALTEEEVQAAVERSEADFTAGRFYSHTLVRQWLAERAPGTSFKEWVAAQDG